MDEFGWGTFFEELANVFLSCYTQIGSIPNERFVNYIIEKLENGLRNVESIHETLSIGSEPENELEPSEEEVIIRYERFMNEVCSVIRFLLSYWDLYLIELQTQASRFSYHVQTTRVPGVRGRPSFNVERNQIEYLRSLNFSWTEISNLLGVSRQTVYRRRSEFGMLDSDPINVVSHEELTGIIQQLRNENPYSGETTI